MKELGPDNCAVCGEFDQQGEHLHDVDSIQSLGKVETRANCGRFILVSIQSPYSTLCECHFLETHTHTFSQ